MMSVIVGSLSKGSSGPSPKVSSSTSVTSRSRSRMPISSALAGHFLGHPANLTPQLFLAHRTQGREIHGADELGMKLLLLPGKHLFAC